MVFQVVAPRQLRELTLGRHRIQFLYQTPRDFEACNRAELLDAIKTPAGFAKVAGAELLCIASATCTAPAESMGWRRS